MSLLMSCSVSLYCPASSAGLVVCKLPNPSFIRSSRLSSARSDMGMDATRRRGGWGVSGMGSAHAAWLTHPPALSSFTFFFYLCAAAQSQAQHQDSVLRPAHARIHRTNTTLTHSLSHTHTHTHRRSVGWPNRDSHLLMTLSLLCSFMYDGRHSHRRLLAIFFARPSRSHSRPSSNRPRTPRTLRSNRWQTTASCSTNSNNLHATRLHDSR